MGESERGEGGGVGKGERLGSEREGGIGERWARKQWGEGGNCLLNLCDVLKTTDDGHSLDVPYLIVHETFE